VFNLNLDGVLVDIRDLQYNALNAAMPRLCRTQWSLQHHPLNCVNCSLVDVWFTVMAHKAFAYIALLVT
jgi:hypothetical protein